MIKTRINAGTILLTKPQTLFRFHQFFTHVLLLYQDRQPFAFAFTCHLSLVFSLWQLPVVPSLSWAWHFWVLLASYFVECPSVWVYLMVSYDWIEVMDLGMNSTELPSCCFHCTRQMLSGCLIPVNWDHTAKDMSVRSLRIKGRIFSL